MLVQGLVQEFFQEFRVSSRVNSGVSSRNSSGVSCGVQDSARCSKMVAGHCHIIVNSMTQHQQNILKLQCSEMGHIMSCVS